MYINNSNMHPNENIMKELINDQWTKDSIFAAVVDASGKIISKGNTTIWEDNDPSAHAEVNAIREACRILKTEKLTAGYWLYSTFEPCPLCASLVIWSGIEGIVYANNPEFRGKEENWSFIKCRDVLNAGKYINDVKLIENFMIDDIKGYFMNNGE